MSKFLKLITLICAIFLTSCDNDYISSFSATNLSRKTFSNRVDLKFGSLQGRICYCIHRTSDGFGPINYTFSLSKGIMNVYYDVNGEKLLIGRFVGQCDVSDSFTEVEKNQPIHFIFKTEEKCFEGRFVVNLS